MPGDKKDPFKEIVDSYAHIESYIKMEEDCFQHKEVSIFATEDTLNSMNAVLKNQYYGKRYGLIQRSRDFINRIGNTFQYERWDLSDISQDNELKPNFQRMLKIIKELYKEQKYPYLLTMNEDFYNPQFTYTLQNGINQIREKFIVDSYNQLSDPDDFVDKKARLLSDFDNSLVDSGLITEREYSENMLGMMAMNSGYNNMIYDKIKSVISHEFNNCDKDLKMLGIKFDANDPDNMNKVRGAAYQLYYTSARFKEYHLNNDTSFKSKVKGKVLPEAFENFKNNWTHYGNPDDNRPGQYLENLKNIGTYMDKLNEAAQERKLADITPEEFVKGIRKYEISHNLTPGAQAANVKNAVKNIKVDLDKITYEIKANDLLHGVDSAFLDELAHNTGNFRTSNSDSYKAMGDALADIRKKMADLEKPNALDYEKLFDACVEYMMQHDSVPTSRSGKKRFQAASVIAGTLAAKLEKSGFIGDPDDSDYVRTAMLRSKDFRNAYTFTLRGEIKNALDSDNLTNEDLEKAWKQKENIELCDKLGKALGKKGMVTGQNVKNDGRATKEQMQLIANTFSGHYVKLDDTKRKTQAFKNNAEQLKALNTWYNIDIGTKRRPVPLDKVNQLW